MQKLAGWFGGAGPEGTGELFEQVGLRPGRESALLAGASEAGGGLLVALGLFTPAAVSMLTGVMTNAIRHVHLQNGLWVTDGGIEYPAVILAVLAALADGGRGGFSLDEALGDPAARPGRDGGRDGSRRRRAPSTSRKPGRALRGGDADDALSRSMEQVGAESLRRRSVEQPLCVPVLPALLTWFGRVVAVELDERVDRWLRTASPPSSCGSSEWSSSQSAYQEAQSGSSPSTMR